MRLIDIEDMALLKTVSCGGLSAKKLWKRIKEQPTIDAVKVVRCKDCKWYKKIVEKSKSGLCHYDLVARCLHDEDYCSHGERKE